MREVADAASAPRPKPPSARRNASAGLPELREAEARAGAALHRLNVALQDLDREEQRAKDRIAELDLRLAQFAADVEREQQLAADAEAALPSSPPRKRPSARRRAKAPAGAAASTPGGARPTANSPPPRKFSAN